VSRIYKYFGNKEHLKKFLERGEIYFNSLSFFLSCEDNSRRDETEDTYIYAPKNGLRVNNLTTSSEHTLIGQLNSKVKEPNRIFVFCASGDLSKHLYKKFCAQGCVAILDVEEFNRRLHSKIKEARRQGTIENDELLSEFVTYYSPNSEPGTRHACPDQIIMSKRDIYRDEKEYRFAFADYAGAFEVNNVEYSLALHPPPPTASTYGSQILQIGSLADICNIVNP
jgi:hypothetical protein